MHTCRFIVIAMIAISANAAAGALAVRVYGPGSDFGARLLEDSSWTMSLKGEIDIGAPARVAAALREIAGQPVSAYISSPGGNLYAGMEIGRLLRKAGANTYVGETVASPQRGKGEPILPEMLTTPARCYSACSLAFLGGVYRYMVKGSEYGVHRVSNPSGPSLHDLDAGQLVSADVSRYIREMGVDPSLFDLMARQSEEGIYVLSDNEIKALNVTNDGRQKPQWSIEVSNIGQYLRGSQTTVYGRGKILLFCIHKTLVMDSFAEVGLGRAKGIATGKWFHSLLVDHEVIPLPNPRRLWVDGDDIRAIFMLTKAESVKIASSESVGHAIQLYRGTATFLGYVVEIPPSAAPKVHGYIENCVDAVSRRGGND